MIVFDLHSWHISKYALQMKLSPVSANLFSLKNINISESLTLILHGTESLFPLKMQRAKGTFGSGYRYCKLNEIFACL